MRERMKRIFDSHHKVASLQPLHLGDIIWIPEHDSEGTVVEEINPTLYVYIYIVQNQNGTL